MLQPSSPRWRVLYRPQRTNIAGAIRRGGGIDSRLLRKVAAGMAPVEAFASPASILAAATKPVTSFVPAQKGQYEICMRNGETSMRAGDFQKATDWFTLASQIAKRSAEAQLSLVHANIALDNYTQSAYHLRRAITFDPELPTRAIDLSKFFRQEADVDEARSQRQLQTMRLKAADAQSDAHLWLSLAYLEWFKGNRDEAASALRKAVHTSNDPLLTEAVEAFWAGGKIRGALAPLDPAPKPLHASAKPTRGAPAKPSGKDTSKDDPKTRS